MGIGEVIAIILGFLVGYGVANLEEYRERKKRREHYIIRSTDNDKRF